jgi:hypothetical protein
VCQASLSYITSLRFRLCSNTLFQKTKQPTQGNIPWRHLRNYPDPTNHRLKGIKLYTYLPWKGSAGH